jgi:hypothetical protein
MRIEGIQHWLTSERRVATGVRYAHQVLRENRERWAGILDNIRGYFRKAHADVIRHMQRLAGVDLHPLRRRPRVDPARFYPCRLHSSVLKGYFGEIFAGVLAEHFAPGGRSDWQVPAFLLRNHRIAFQQLERFRQTGDPPGPIPGRFGDDCLAFRRNARGGIVAALYCEAKCTAEHDRGMVGEAHEKLSTGAVVDVLQLIEILEDAETADAQEWVEALRQFHLKLAGTGWERVDLLCYICGKHPRQQSSWLRRDRPHAKYQSQGRHLEAIEVHLHDVDSKVAAVYAEKAWV